MRSMHYGVVRLWGRHFVVVVCSHCRREKVEGIRFYSLPTWKRDDPLPRVRDFTRRRRMAWIAAVRRPEFKFESNIPAHMKVCSRHFHQGKAAYEMLECDADWAPTKHLGHTEVKASNLERCGRRRSRVKRQQAQVDGPPTPANTGQEAEMVFRFCIL